MLAALSLMGAEISLYIGNMRNTYTILIQNLMGRDLLEDLGVYGTFTLKRP
jgi:hypothetical protein